MARLLTLLVFMCFVVVAAADMVKMRLIQEIKSYSWQQPLNNQQRETEESGLTMRIKPYKLVGPKHLNYLQQKCYTKVIEKYRYKLCPYANLTQIENDVYWSPYKGVLGVWNGWVIEDNKFIEMKMKEGDQCGVAPRESRINLQCGEKTEILSVAEYSHCKYRVNFSTPIVCHDDSMLVYPTLEQTYRDRWDQIYTEFKNDELTLKGYKIELTQLFDKAGLSGSSDPYNTSADDSVTKKTDQKQDKESQSHPFTQLNTCNQEYAKLKIECEAKNITGP